MMRCGRERPYHTKVPGGSAVPLGLVGSGALGKGYKLADTCKLLTGCSMWTGRLGRAGHLYCLARCVVQLCGLLWVLPTLRAGLLAGAGMGVRLGVSPFSQASLPIIGAEAGGGAAF